MNPSLPESKTMLRLNKEELLAKFAVGPVSVNGIDKSGRNTIHVSVGVGGA